MKIGVLGGGQLGRMTALAGYPLGLTFRFMDTGDPPVATLAELVRAGFEDSAALDRFADGLDVVTYEFENVPVAAAEYLARRVPVYPPPEALTAAQDRINEKTLFSRLGIPVPAFAQVDQREDLEPALEVAGLPAVLKTRRLGYDGKGQAVIGSHSDLDRAWSALGTVPLILESLVSFDRELSIIAVRSSRGETIFYPLVENHHRGGILRLSLAPAPDLRPELQALAERHAAAVLDAVDYVGVLTIEFFQVGGVLLANEMAPRVHNSGHWTIEGARTSQFENHLRAITGLPLGDCGCIGCSAMVNLIGTTPDHESVLRLTDAHLHLYGKSPRPGRKLGHVTMRAETPPALSGRLAEFERAAALPISGLLRGD